MIENVIFRNIMSSTYDITLKHPRRMLIYGPSGSGKSTFVEKLLYYMKELFDFYFDKIIYCSEQWFPSYDSIHGIFIDKVTNIERNMIENLNSNENNLIILDDNMHKFCKDPLISDIFTKYSHHKNIFVIILFQTNFPNEKFKMDISSNSSYIVLMSNPMNEKQMSILCSQRGGAFITECYKDATNNKAYSYLFLDCDQETPDEVRVRTDIFPNEIPTAFIKLSKI